MLGLLWLSACATPLEQPHRPEQEQARIAHGVMVAVDGALLPMRQWLPEGTPKAVLLCLHGFNDYGQAFLYPGIQLSRLGIAVYAYDQRGFGASPAHGIWAGRQNLTRDLRSAVLALRREYPETPLYVLGESMGGAVVVSALAEPDFPEIDGTILSAPAVWGGETMNWLYQLSLWLMAHSLPDMALTGRGLNILASSNIPMLRALGQDPLVIKETRVDAIYGIVSLMDYAFGEVAALKQPLLLLYGAQDQVIPAQPIWEAVRKMPESARIAYYPDGYHMLLRDLDAPIVLRDIASWIMFRERRLPSGYEQGRSVETAGNS